MSSVDALLEVQRGFDLDDDLSLTDLRSPGWLQKLHQTGKLRILQRNKTVGVLVEPAVWGALQDLVQDLLEDMAIEERFGDRVKHERLPGSVAGSILLRLVQKDVTGNADA